MTALEGEKKSNGTEGTTAFLKVCQSAPPTPGGDRCAAVHVEKPSGKQSFDFD
jgi:hypothetical protein